ncbi:hypothetical protein DUNSADRAFT_15912 [Dunaliella salina]|uniref:PSP proline-rich domain-containing protein n=1 Tax=Dunaliella salina TaxID=3046 RepID=A0ABQ7H1E0_DUNSA|nr:hypothetical protein DUNSADRAFT_15912 [Dunaliella salina]|eukprot:KAF5840669.1 hypothetical protein DUNSADRAFT_15912 [Dunaliella salina]
MMEKEDQKQLANGDVGVEYRREQLQQPGQEQQLLPNGNAEQEQQHEEHAEAQANGAKQKMDRKLKQKEKKQKHKQNRQQRRQEQLKQPTASKEQGPTTDEDNVQIEYVSAPLELGTSEKNEEQQTQPEEEAEGMGYGLGLGFSKPKEDPYADFKKIFERFATAEQVTGVERPGEESDEGAGKGEERTVKEEQRATSTAPEEDEEGDPVEEGKKKLSKRQRKMINQLKIAELKQLAERPDVVEVWDVTSPDPQMLVYLKSYRNTAPVPRHWSQKRKYLQGKRGIEKPPFKLPDFIEATGIGEMRQGYTEKESTKSLQSKQRARMQPKMGKMDIDYQVLHDAFFKYQTKPKLTQLGEMYYEGKEFEARVENAKPGVLSEDLRKALGMGEDAPPPWLINMQRYGPPPSYPNLRIPGLNAPIPPGAQFGYHPGGWGKPPVDEEGNPIYGDVFGQHIGEAESDDEVSALADGISTGIQSGMASGYSGIASSLPSGIETPDVSVQLRKGHETEQPQLYQVLEQRQAPLAPGTLLGTDHVYVLPGQQKKGGVVSSVPGRPGAPGDVEVTLTPEEMEGLDEGGLKALYEQKLAEVRAGNKREDFSDMVAAKAAQQKRKAQQKADGGKKQKTGKDFKF